MQDYDSERIGYEDLLNYANALRRQGMQNTSGSGYHGGRVYMVGNALPQIINSLGGNLLAGHAQRGLADVEARNEKARNDWMAAMPSATEQKMVEQFGPAIPGEQMPSTPTAFPKSAKQRQQEMTTWAAGAPRGMEGARQYALQQALLAPKEEQAREERAAAAQAELAAKFADKEAQREWQAGQNEMYKRTFEQAMTLKQAPTVHVSVNGGGQGATDGKPLTGPQEKAALELGSNYGTLQDLASRFKDEYAGGPGKALERAAGGLAGGLAPEATQKMTRWWADQAMFDELVQRHALFGATLTPNEQKAWRESNISPNLAPKVIRERMATRERLYKKMAERQRGSIVAGGRSGAQFDAATGFESNAAPPVVPEAIPTDASGFKVLNVR